MNKSILAIIAALGFAMSTQASFANEPSAADQANDAQIIIDSIAPEQDMGTLIPQDEEAGQEDMNAQDTQANQGGEGHPL